MSETPLNRSAPCFPIAVRLLMGAGGLGLWCLLIVARCLQPSSAGMGTHQQLGLPPCGMVRLTGTPCPSCGMTTSWSHFTRGRILDSLGANPGGTLLALAALLSGPWLLLSGWTGRWIPGALSVPWLLSLIGLLMAVTVTQWIVRLLV